MNALRHQGVGRVALQTTDLDRLAFGNLADADFLAERFRWADTRAHAPHDVLRQDCLGRRFGCAGGNLADEKRDVDIRGTGGDARRIVAEITPIRGHQSLVIAKRRVQIGKAGA